MERKSKTTESRNYRVTVYEDNTGTIEKSPGESMGYHLLKRVRNLVPTSDKVVNLDSLKLVIGKNQVDPTVPERGHQERIEIEYHNKLAFFPLPIIDSN